MSAAIATFLASGPERVGLTARELAPLVTAGSLRDQLLVLHAWQTVSTKSAAAQRRLLVAQACIAASAVGLWLPTGGAWKNQLNRRAKLITEMVSQAYSQIHGNGAPDAQDGKVAEAFSDTVTSLLVQPEPIRTFDLGELGQAVATQVRVLVFQAFLIDGKTVPDWDLYSQLDTRANKDASELENANGHNARVTYAKRFAGMTAQWLAQQGISLDTIHDCETQLNAVLNMLTQGKLP